MTSIPPVPVTYDGDAFVPLNKKIADRHYAVGEVYRLAPIEERSLNSHKFFFAALNEAFKNLPIEWSGLFSSVLHFRKYCLIMEGYRTERVIAAGSEKDARMIAATVETLDPFAVVNIAETVVTIWIAESQSMKAMKRERFQESKTAVLNRAASMIGVTPETLRENAGND